MGPRWIWFVLAVMLLAVFGPVALAQEAAAAAEARQPALKQLGQLGMAIQNYHDANFKFPPPAILRSDGTPLLSWRVALLPYLGADEAKLFAQFKLDEPWDSPHNLSLLLKMPDVYRCRKSRMNENGCTVYQAPRGEHTMFPDTGHVSDRRITDGLSNTMMIVEVDDSRCVPWTSPQDWTFDASNAVAGLGGHFEGRFLVVFADGFAHSLKTTIDNEVLRAMLTCAGQEVVQVPD